MGLLMGKRRKKLILLMLTVLIFAWLLINPVLSLLGVGETNLVEAFAVPMQQVARVLAQGRELTEQEVLEIQQRKTGCLIRAACAMGAVAGGANEEQYDAACQFAAGLGLAFQIRDDMLDVIGTREEMGKSIGTDAVKNTFVRLYGLERCEELVQKYTNYAIDALGIFEDPSYLIALAKKLTDRRT
jgi:geranylgeranyl diphosphate synthase type II